MDAMWSHRGNAAAAVGLFLATVARKVGTRRCIDVLAWLFLAPILLVLLGIPIFICIGSVIAIFKTPQSLSRSKSNPCANFGWGIKEP